MTHFVMLKAKQTHILFLVAGSVILVAALVFWGITALSQSPGDTSPGTTAPGAHSFKSLDGDINIDYCISCHTVLSPTHPVVSEPCLDCHSPQGGAHSASPFSHASVSVPCETCHGAPGP